jgi:SMODS-associating 2TM, beta-strand rich effector domain
MHPYGTDSEERRVMPLLVAVISLALAVIVHGVIEAAGVGVPWWIDTPTPLALYGVLWLGLDRVAWRWRVLRALRLVKVPDLHGQWKLGGQSDFETMTEFTGTATVRQTWTHISIETETDQSRAHSVSASILLGPSARPRVTYQYVNEPKANAVETLQSHTGTGWLEFEDGALVGEYYGGRGSRNIGTLRLVRSVNGDDQAKVNR